ncbi:hypothetical protein K1719_040391 [Acacia pycnantha]|nr:hypothetical protein K1719_040391 [Acacia pycnantha]
MILADLSNLLNNLVDYGSVDGSFLLINLVQVIFLLPEMFHAAYIELALWLHRRFLSSCWINHFLTNSIDASNASKETSRKNHVFGKFLEDELRLTDLAQLL